VHSFSSEFEPWKFKGSRQPFTWCSYVHFQTSTRVWNKWPWVNHGKPGGGQSRALCSIHKLGNMLVKVFIKLKKKNSCNVMFISGLLAISCCCTKLVLGSNSSPCSRTWTCVLLCKTTVLLHRTTKFDEGIWCLVLKTPFELWVYNIGKLKTP
jgi:hypothetical protein